jgi:F-type H+-transporting ATPase subunit alpha
MTGTGGNRLDLPPETGSLFGPLVAAVDRALASTAPNVSAREVGVVSSVRESTARVRGLPGVEAEELVRFDDGTFGLALNLDADAVGVVLLDEGAALEAGTEVRRTGRVLDVPVGAALLGRVVDALGRPLDERGPVRTATRHPVERPAPPVMHRAPVEVPLQTGLKVIDALLPIGRGQRELILGDRQTGKTTIALDAIANQRETGVVAVYCAVGKETAAIAKTVAALRRRGALAHTVVVVAGGDEPPGLQFVAPYAATSVAEHFVDQGQDVLIVYDDLTWHARAYRELSLLLERPPGREAYPGDIFYLHARLLERATRLRPARGGGSLTALPIAETQAQNLSAFIPTNLISITDGQVVCSSTLFAKGHLPAVDIGLSVSRVGGRAQRPAYRAVAGPLRLAYAQFQELEAFARFSTRLDPATRRRVERGRRVREVLKQPQNQPRGVAEQVAVMRAVTGGAFDAVPLGRIESAEEAVCVALETAPALRDRLDADAPLTDEVLGRLDGLIATATEGLSAGPPADDRGIQG